MAARHRLRLNTRLIVTRYLVITGVGFLLLELTAVSKVNRLPFPSWIVQSAYRDLRYPPVVLFHLSSLPTYLPTCCRQRAPSRISASTKGRGALHKTSISPSSSLYHLYLPAIRFLSFINRRRKPCATTIYKASDLRHT